MVWRYRELRINKAARGLVHSRYTDLLQRLSWPCKLLQQEALCCHIPADALACFLQDTGKLIVAVASADTPVAVRASSVSSLTPSGIEKRHRAVAASPTRFFELLVYLICQQSR